MTVITELVDNISIFQTLNNCNNQTSKNPNSLKTYQNNIRYTIIVRYLEYI